MLRTSCHVLLAALLLGWSVSALAQDMQPLSGPRVVETESTSLAEPGFAGMGEMPQDRAEIVALRRLDLDDQTRAAVDAVLLEHAKALDGVVVDHLLDLNGWITAIRTGTQAERLGALSEIHRAMAPVRALGPLDERIRGVLPEEQRQVFDRLLNDHQAALEQQARSEAQARGERFAPVRYRARRALEEMGRDVGAAYERTIASRSGAFEAFLAEAQVSPEGEALIRRAVMDLYQRTEFRPTPPQTQRAVLSVLGSLSEADRAGVIRVLRAR